MWIKTILLVCCVLATLAAKEPKKKDDRGKRNLQYNVAHHFNGPHAYRRISTGPQIPIYHSPFFPGPRSYSPYKGRPYSLPAPPYAVQMEPLVHYSQRDPLYNTNSLSLNADGQDDLLTDNNHLTENIYGPHPQKQIIERPVYIKEPEPIIEIIIKESNVTLPPPPAPPTPPPKKKEQVQVFYVKYKKNPNGHGKDAIIYDKPVPAISPPIHDEQEESPQVENYHHEVVTQPPPPSTTLRTIIRPDSETYHSPSGVKVTFGKEGFDYDKRSPKSEDLKASLEDKQSVQFPQGRQLSQFPSSGSRRPSTYSFTPPPNYRQPQPYRPFTQFRQPNSQSFSRPNQQEYSTLPKFPPFSQPPKNFPPPRPAPPQFQRQPIPYQPFESIRQPPSVQFRPETHFPITQSPPITQKPVVFNSRPQFTEGRPQKPQFPSKPQFQQPSELNINPKPQFHQPPEFSQKPQFSQPSHFNEKPQFHESPQFSQKLPFQESHSQFTQKPEFHEPSRPQFPQKPEFHESSRLQFSQKPEFHEPSRTQFTQKPEFHEPPRSQFPQKPEFREPTHSQFSQKPQFHEPSPPQFSQKLPFQESSQLQFGQKQQFREPSPPQFSQKLPFQESHQPHFQQNFVNHPAPQQFQQQAQHPQSQSSQYQQRPAQQHNQFNQQQTIIPPGGELIQSVPKYEQHISVSEPLKPSQNQPQYQIQQSSIKLPTSSFSDKNQQQTQSQQNDYNSKIQQQIREANALQESIRQSQPQYYNFQQSQSLNYYQSTTKPTTTTTKSTTTTTTQKPSTTTKDPKLLNAQLPDEVPDDLRQQLLSSGILNNADISVLDYDKVGDIPLSALPPDQLANFYSAGGAQQIQAAGSEPIPLISQRDLNQEASEIHEVTVKPEVQMKVVRYDPESDRGQQVQESYVKDDATQVDPVVLNDNTYNRYLPLKISGTQFPIPDVPELKGKKITSVVVLAPVAYDFSKSRQTRNAKNKEIELLEGTILKDLLENPSKENFEKFLEKENQTRSEKQAVILLVAGANDKNQDKEIFMYDIATKTVSKLDGELSSAFVDAAEANSSADTKTSASNIVETRIPYEVSSDLSESGSENFETFVDLSGNPVDDLTASETRSNEEIISKTGRLT